MTKKVPIIKENSPTTSMGMSSSTPGTGAIDTFDPILNHRKKVVRNIMTVWRRAKVNSHGKNTS